ncbi:MAG: Uma2 family endonuclease [Acidobacteriota bacterium]
MSQRATKRKVSDDVPPLEAGDRLTRDEFERRYEAMPNLKKAELINGVVYLDSTLSPNALKTTTGVPPLENGDHLTRDEFERRYDAMPNLKKAELIEGVVFMGSPVRIRSHSKPHGVINGLLSFYSITTPGTEFGDNGTLRLDLGNDPQPDCFLRIEEEYGGQSVVSADDYLEGGPELVVEVSASTASHDLNAKKQVYQRHGVHEYIVWRTHDEAIDWFELRRGRYVRVNPDTDGIIESKVFPGLRLMVSALARGEYAAALRELQAGVASAKHEAFVAALAKRKKKKK